VSAPARECTLSIARKNANFISAQACSVSTSDMDNYSRPLGHSNASLFASADEMAGDYSPQNNNHDFIPARNTPASRAQLSGGVPLNSHPRIDTVNMELHYPMPDQAEVWHQAEHPDTIPKVLNYEGDICMETFKGAAKILSHANPEQFLMPLKVNTSPELLISWLRLTVF
jgi:hypothetical protein